MALEFVRPRDRLTKQAAWEQFRKDARFRRLHNVSDEELDTLSRVTLMGEIDSPRDFFYILNTIRYALGR
jgi:hypothetical protein